MTAPAEHRAHRARPTRRQVPPLHPEDADAGLLVRVAAVVAAQPDAVALADDEGELTFGELAVLAARVALDVAALGLRTWSPGADDADVDPVAVLAGHRASTVAAVLGVIAAGAPVVVLDPALPEARLRRYVERAGAAAVLTDPGLADRAAMLPARVLALPTGPAGPTLVERARSGEIVPPGRPAPDVLAPAALVFTSGTTGTPKGVVYDHRLFPRSAFNVSVRDGTYDADDVLASVLPLGFSAGLDHTLAGIQVGARQQMRDLRTAGAAEVVRWLAESGVTVMNISPSLARGMISRLAPGQVLDGLRSVTLTSEAVHRADVEALRGALPADCALSNRWGASETGLATVLPLPADAPVPTGQLPVGWPVAGVELSVEKDGGPDAVPATDGTGVIAVTSGYIARRYWRDPEKTAAAFTELPDGRRRFLSADVGRLDDTGCFLLLGRRDHSAKVRGYLVEPGEVEAALFAMPDVREAVVVGVTEGPRTRLVAYVVSTAERPAAAVVRAGVREVLPTWMVPETVVFLDALPRTERGKVDRAALPAAPELVPGGDPPRTPWEEAVADVWARVLGLPEVGIRDDFFELGGDSLAAEALGVAVHRELGVPERHLTSTLLLGAPTVEEFAARLSREPDAVHPTLVPLRTQGSAAPVFCFAGGGALGLTFHALARRLDPDVPVWGLQATGLEHGGRPDWSVRASARRQVSALRTVQPHGPYRLVGHSFGAVLAFEAARQLRAMGEEVAQLVLVDAFPPGTRDPEPPPRGLVRRIRDVLGLLATGFVPNPGHGHFWRFHRQAIFLTSHYHPGPWDGPALVLVVDGPERAMCSDWGAYLTGEWRVQTIPGDHHSLLREPYVGALADAVGREIGSVRPG